MRGETMKGKSKKSTYSTTFGVDPFFAEKQGKIGKFLIFYNISK